MRKKILLGSMLVLTLLLLMPSIPAIQQYSVENEINKQIQENFETINPKDFKVSDRIKHPFLYKFVSLINGIQFLRYCLTPLWVVVFCVRGDELGSYYIHPILYDLLYLREVHILLRLSAWYNFWMDKSDTFGWNWDLRIPWA